MEIGASVPRFVEVPTIPQEIFNQTLNEAGRPKRLEKQIVLDELKNEETKHLAVDWLVKIGLSCVWAIRFRKTVSPF